MTAMMSAAVVMHRAAEIDKWASRSYACNACGHLYRSLAPLSFCPSCLSSLYVQGK